MSTVPHIPLWPHPPRCLVGRGGAIALLRADVDLAAPRCALPGRRTLRRVGDHHLHRGLDQPARSRHRQYSDQPHFARLCAGRSSLRRTLLHQRAGAHDRSVRDRGNGICICFSSASTGSHCSTSAPMCSASEVSATVAAAAVLMLLGLPCNLASKLLGRLSGTPSQQLGDVCGRGRRRRRARAGHRVTSFDACAVRHVRGLPDACQPQRRYLLR